MNELMRFLLARLTDDEYHLHHPASGEPCEHATVATGWWPPERVMAECAAKRRILLAAADPSRWHVSGSPIDAATVHTVLRCLAMPYHDHPEFRPEWLL